MRNRKNRKHLGELNKIKKNLDKLCIRKLNFDKIA